MSGPNRLTGRPLTGEQRELVEALEACPHPEGAVEWRCDSKRRPVYVWCARCGAMQRAMEWESPTYGEDDDGKPLANPTDDPEDG
jgi:hypothetical protein